MSNYLTGFSAAAQTYVVSLTGDDCTRSKRDTARHAFDAGAASVAVPAETITTAAELAAILKMHDSDRMECMNGHGGRCCPAPECAHGYVSQYLHQADAIIEALGLPASPPVTAPVLLTADDPRWRDGAKVRGEFADGSAVEGILIRREIRWGDPDYYYLYTGNLAAIYLIAEAPDPDADDIASLLRIGDRWSQIGLGGDITRSILADLRADGWNRADA